MVKSVTPIAGVDVEAVWQGNFASGGSTVNTQPPFESGTTVWADDGHQYIYATAGTAIPASSDTLYNETNRRMSFVGPATASWTSPPTAMVQGDGAWFKKTDLV